MAVPCRQCGREYDVALFAFGRTISCTCGRRVGIEPRVRPERLATERRFVADAMLGRLARWLRLLGFDCVFDAEASDEQVVRRAIEDGRVLLTRDRRLPEEWWISDIHLVQEQEPRRQLAEVVRHFDLGASIRVLTRCSRCNRTLERITRAQASGRVPSRILEDHEPFSECLACGRVYWEGSHAARIRALVDRVLANT